MPTKIIRHHDHIDALAAMLRFRKLPITVTWTQGEVRSTAQNRLAQQWYSDITTQLGDQTREDVRAECKMRFGVPILRAENQAFQVSYDRVLKHLPYEEKLQAIRDFDLPVTRLMTVKQMQAFLTEVQQHYIKQGVRLTDPEALKYEQEFEALNA